jgi:hypothetical protein
LSIYAAQLIEQVAGEGGEIMLEPMSAADRKVIHDAVALHSGVRSYSEGEPPRRYVVIASVETDEESPGDEEISEDEAEQRPKGDTDWQEDWVEGGESEPDEA